MRRTHVALCFLLLGLATAAPAQSGAPAEADLQLVDALLARADAVFSGRMTYSFTMGTEGQKPAHDAEGRFVFSGSSWIQRGHGSNGQPDTEMVCHNGTTLAYIPTQQADGRITKLARVSPTKSFDSLGVKPPVFAGTFWRANTKRYVAANRQAVVNKGQAVVNGIETVVLEWDVPAGKSGDAFKSFPSALQFGGRVRVYVAPQLGHALPRVEFLSRSGAPGTRFDATDFVRTPAGIFIPKELSSRRFPDKPKAAAFVEEYHIRDVENINEPIPDSTFSVDVPDKTEVIDSRSGRGSTRFILDKEKPPPAGLDDVLAREPPSFWGRNRTTAITAGLAAGAVVVLALAAWLRRRAARRRSATP